LLISPNSFSIQFQFLPNLAETTSPYSWSAVVSDVESVGYEQLLDHHHKSTSPQQHRHESGSISTDQTYKFSFAY
jgi:hypothetical protein